MEYFPIKKTTIYDQTAVTVQEMVLTDEAVTANHTPPVQKLKLLLRFNDITASVYQISKPLDQTGINIVYENHVIQRTCTVIHHTANYL